MNPVVPEWIEKAEGDYATAGREMRVRKNPNYDAVCFHAQQCAEKYMKAMLLDANVSFTKTHNLIALLELLLPLDATWEILRPQLQRLNGYAVQARYPGETADRSIAREALGLCSNVRLRARSRLGLKP